MIDLSAYTDNPDINISAGDATDTLVLSMGPQHPSTHGVLRVMLQLDGETVVKAEPEPASRSKPRTCSGSRR